jgi:hypothetical protein
MYVCMYVCMYVYVCIYVCMYVYTYTHTHTLKRSERREPFLSQCGCPRRRPPTSNRRQDRLHLPLPFAGIGCLCQVPAAKEKCQKRPTRDQKRPTLQNRVSVPGACSPRTQNVRWTSLSFCLSLARYLSLTRISGSQLAQRVSVA